MDIKTATFSPVGIFIIFHFILLLDNPFFQPFKIFWNSSAVESSPWLSYSLYLTQSPAIGAARTFSGRSNASIRGRAWEESSEHRARFRSRTYKNQSTFVLLFKNIREEIKN